MADKKIADRWDIAVVGAGASGLMAAIAASQGPEKLRIAVLEKNDRVGKKLLATGNGRCNYTNVNCCSEDLGSFSKAALEQLPPAAVLDFFAEAGVYPRVEEEGRVYPYSGQGAAVLSALLEKAQKQGCTFFYHATLKNVTIIDEGFLLTTEKGMELCASKVILALSGKAGIQYGSAGEGYRIAEGLGHTIVKPVPSLVALSCSDVRCAALKGVRAKGRVTLQKNGGKIAADQGEIQFNEDGLSGICVFNLSGNVRFGKDREGVFTVLVDLLPELSVAEATALLKQRRASLAERPAGQFLYGLLHEKLSAAIMDELLSGGTAQGSRTPAANLTDRQLAILAEMLKGWVFHVTGTRSWKDAQVTSGGVRTKEINPQTMESLKAPGVYIVGELLDVDGRCGGYNLQWAWSSGWTAGKAAARTQKLG